jgi:hypothetical protein
MLNTWLTGYCAEQRLKRDLANKNYLHIHKKRKKR